MTVLFLKKKKKRRKNNPKNNKPPYEKQGGITQEMRGTPFAPLAQHKELSTVTQKPLSPLPNFSTGLAQK